MSDETTKPPQSTLKLVSNNNEPEPWDPRSLKVPPPYGKRFFDGMLWEDRRTHLFFYLLPNWLNRKSQNVSCHLEMLATALLLTCDAIARSEHLRPRFGNHTDPLRIIEGAIASARIRIAKFDMLRMSQVEAAKAHQLRKAQQAPTMRPPKPRTG